MNRMRKSWIIVCFVNFIIAALMGLAMRFSNVAPIAVDYAKLIHAHSHAAMLGWVYLMIFTQFTGYFVPPEKQKKYNGLFWVTQFSVVGMMISFPIQGYALFSISFSTLHILCSYVFTFRIWKDNQIGYRPVKRLVFASLGFMLFSTLGAWSLGIIASVLGKDSPFYQTAIQFFVHFQFNGWFVFAVMAVFLAMLRQHGFEINKKYFGRFYYSLMFSAIVTFALPLSWFFSFGGFFYANCLGVAVQLLALIWFLRMIGPAWPVLLEKYSGAKWIFLLSLASFTLKIAMQIITVFRVFAQASHTVRNFTIGFIHLGTLGLITGFLFFFLTMNGFIDNRKRWSKAGMWLFFAGFLTTELVLFLGGMLQFVKAPPIPFYPGILFGASVLLPLGLLALLIAVVKKPGAASRGIYD